MLTKDGTDEHGWDQVIQVIQPDGRFCFGDWPRTGQRGLSRIKTCPLWLAATGIPIYWWLKRKQSQDVRDVRQ